ncbi:MAG: transketolase [Clostridiales Family XIII bacterium]|jgi:transketolase|nr:transketolase [Clostridiales Family XIII bacterium]
MDKETARERKRFAKRIQMETVKMIAKLGVGHIGGALSMADLLAVLYGGQLRHDPQNPQWKGRDWLVCSKGHAGPGLYAALALRGYFPLEQLDTLNRPGTMLPSHCDRNLTLGIDMTTGSLGQGASSAAGIALAHKLDKAENIVYLILGDGEIQEGQVWEMALFAAQQKLSNLIVFVDNNHLQIDGPTDEVNSLGDIAAKFRSFGWFAADVCGHDPVAIDDAIELAKRQTEAPSVIVLDTVKGNGWTATAGKAGSHSRTISEDEKNEALLEMQQAYDEI